MTGNRLLFVTLFAFLSGSVMYSYILPLWLKGVDVRDAHSDRNPGAWNALRSCGRGMCALCAALDVLKATLPVYAAIQLYGIDGYRLLPVAVAPVLGHAFSPWLHFRGGKAIAASFGALLGMITVAPVFWIMAAATIICVIAIKDHATAMCSACALAALAAVALGQRGLLGAPYSLILACVCLIMFHKHRKEGLQYLRARRSRS